MRPQTSLARSRPHLLACATVLARMCLRACARTTTLVEWLDPRQVCRVSFLFMLLGCEFARTCAELRGRHSPPRGNLTGLASLSLMAVSLRGPIISLSLFLRRTFVLVSLFRRSGLRPASPVLFSLCQSFHCILIISTRPAAVTRVGFIRKVASRCAEVCERCDEESVALHVPFVFDSRIRDVGFYKVDASNGEAKRMLYNCRRCISFFS